VREGGLPYFIALLRSSNEQAQEHAAVLMQNLSMDATNQVTTQQNPGNPGTNQQPLNPEL